MLIGQLFCLLGSERYDRDHLDLPEACQDVVSALAARP